MKKNSYQKLKKKIQHLEGVNKNLVNDLKQILVFDNAHTKQIWKRRFELQDSIEFTVMFGKRQVGSNLKSNGMFEYINIEDVSL